MAVLPDPREFSVPVISDGRWRVESRKYQLLASRFMAALPKRHVARAECAPSEIVSLDVESDEAEVVDRAIATLSEALRKSSHRRYVVLEDVRGVEHCLQISNEWRALRLLRYFDVDPRVQRMVTRIDVGLA